MIGLHADFSVFDELAHLSEMEIQHLTGALLQALLVWAMAGGIKRGMVVEQTCRIYFIGYHKSLIEASSRINH